MYNVKHFEGKRIAVKEYLKLLIERNLPLVDRICVGEREIDFRELFLDYLDEEAVFFNNEKYEYDDESEWSIDSYELLIDDPVQHERVVDDSLIFIEEAFFDD